MDRRVQGKSERFTLIELLVVIVIIMILASMLLPALGRAKILAKYARWQGYSNSLRAHDNLVAYYTWEQATDENVPNMAASPVAHPEYAPEALDGTPMNGAAVTDGRWLGTNKKGMSFGGTSSGQHVFVGHSPALDITENITMMAWIFQTTPHIGVILQKGYAASDRYQFSVMTDGRIQHCYNGCAYSASSSVQIGKWQMVAITNDGTTVRYYVDGVEVDTDSGVISYGKATQEPMRLGRNENAGAWHFTGVMDEVALYNAAITPQEVMDHYLMGHP